MSGLRPNIFLGLHFAVDELSVFKKKFGLWLRATSLEKCPDSSDLHEIMSI